MTSQRAKNANGPVSSFRSHSTRKNHLAYIRYIMHWNKSSAMQLTWCWGTGRQGRATSNTRGARRGWKQRRGQRFGGVWGNGRFGPFSGKGQHLAHIDRPTIAGKSIGDGKRRMEITTQRKRECSSSFQRTQDFQWWLSEAKELTEWKNRDHGRCRRWAAVGGEEDEVSPLIKQA